jgi:Family of unknown function (DUF5302)
MTKSAKRDTAKAPAQAAGSQAAEPGAAAAGSAAIGAEGEDGTAVEQGAAVPPPAGATAQHAAQDPAQDTAVQDNDAADLDETKRKFREALDRKNQAHTENQGKGGRDGGKISGAHGPAASRRSFRRKSG